MELCYGKTQMLGDAERMLERGVMVEALCVRDKEVVRHVVTSDNVAWSC